MSLESEKQVVVNEYLDQKDAERAAILPFAADFNAVREEVNNDLLGKKDTGLFSALGEGLKKAVFKNVANTLDIQSVDYNTIEIRMFKELLEKATTEQQLASLKQQIKAGKNIADITLDVPSTTISSSDTSSPSPSSSTPDPVEYTTVGSTLLLSQELQKVRDKIEVKGSFANIKKVQNAEGKVILECTAKTPFINEKALDDLLGLADEFFKITGQPLSLNSAYRTIDHQKQLKKKNAVPTAAAGKSGHNLGLSIDIEKTDKKEKALGGLQGFRDIAKKYHFTPIDSEDWHFDHESLPKSDQRLTLAQTLNKEFSDERLAA